MKLVIISTTIQGEKGYLPFDELAANSKFSDVTFVIAGDVSSKFFDVSKFKCKVEYLLPKDQERFACSKVIGWKTPRRRPIAWLRAIELSPDFILTIDDDNFPSPDYFDKWYEVLSTPKNFLATSSNKDEPWYNYLETSDASLPIYPRGYPIPFRGRKNENLVKTPLSIFPPHIGLFQGISLGDPDMDSMTRIVHEKRVYIKKVDKKNYCLNNVWSPYNMQNTILTKSLFPLPILWPGNGRYDDIFASFTWQQILFNNKMYVHVGDPLNFQDRGNRNIVKLDFPLEVEGYLEAQNVWKQITTIKEKDGIKFMEKLMKLPHPLIQREKIFFKAYLKDVKKILKNAKS